MRTFARFAICLLLSAAAYAQESGKIFLVRHAEKQSDTPDTPLSDKGQARAQCLAQTLKDAHITTVIVTQYLRTKQTAAPTVADSKANEMIVDAKSTDQIVKESRTAAQSGNVLIVGHSNTIPTLLAAFGALAVSIPDTAYDQLFIFDVAQPKQLTILHYCPALPTDTTAHPANSMANP
jgi:broad specificity phosphatase PhoE